MGVELGQSSRNMRRPCAGHARANDPIHNEPAWNVFQLFGVRHGPRTYGGQSWLTLADRAQLAAAGAIARAQHGVVARQFRR